MKTKILLTAIVSSFILHPSAFAQGALTPPGAPAPTMKTLAQIEPRTPISSLPYTISSSGSYYLTTNLVNTNTAGGFNGITIASGVNDVTLDLNGFTLADAVTNAVFQYGINAPGNNTNLVVRNGTLRNWTTTGIGFYGVNGGKIENVTCIGIGTTGNGAGIEVGSRFQVVNCQGINSVSGFAANTVDNSFNHCVASFCSQIGFSISSSNTTLVDCQAHDNAGYGFYFFTPASRSSFLNCSANNNGVVGFDITSTNTVIQGCSAKNNQTGIIVTSSCEVLNNECANNSSQGFYIGGNGNRVDGNSSINGVFGTGFYVISTGNFIVRNTSRGGAVAFSIPAGNSSGPVVDVYNAGNGTNNITSSAWANFSY